MFMRNSKTRLRKTVDLIWIRTEMIGSEGDSIDRKTKIMTPNRQLYLKKSQFIHSLGQSQPWKSYLGM